MALLRLGQETGNSIVQLTYVGIGPHASRTSQKVAIVEASDHP